MAKKTFTPIPPMAELPPAEEINVRELLEKYLSGEIDLICVLGPTASGKTRYAVSLARQINHLLARYAMKKQAECSDQGQYNDQVSCLSNAPWAVSACEKRATPLAAGGGAHDEGVGGVLFAADPSEGAGANIKSEASGRQGSVLPPWTQGEGPAPKGAIGVLFAADPSEGAGANIKSEASDCQGSVLPPWTQGEGPAPKEWEGFFPDSHVPLTQKRAEIISADSRQVYRGMDIGTGKDLSEYEEIPYHLMDIVDAGTKYNIFEYQRDFEKAYKDIRDRGCIPILCGGSGLYIEAATCGYSLPEVQPDPELRAELEKKSDEELIAQLASLKQLHNNTDYDTRKRLIRALEIAIYEAEHPVNRTSFLPKNTYYIGTLVSRDERNARIDRRLDARIEEGMVEEIRSLIDGSHPALAPEHKPIPVEDLIYYGLEYKFVTQHVIGELTLEEMRTQLATAIHQFAKRQMTWFRGMERKGIRIHWTEV